MIPIINISNISDSGCEIIITEGVPETWFYFVVIILFGYMILSEYLYGKSKAKKMSNVQQDNAKSNAQR